MHVSKECENVSFGRIHKQSKLHSYLPTGVTGIGRLVSMACFDLSGSQDPMNHTKW